jgi:hypothetical protein
MKMIMGIAYGEILHAPQIKMSKCLQQLQPSFRDLSLSNNLKLRLMVELLQAWYHQFKNCETETKNQELQAKECI